MRVYTGSQPWPGSLITILVHCKMSEIVHDRKMLTPSCLTWTFAMASICSLPCCNYILPDVRNFQFRLETQLISVFATRMRRPSDLLWAQAFRSSRNILRRSGHYSLGELLLLGPIHKGFLLRKYMGGPGALIWACYFTLERAWSPILLVLRCVVF